MEVVFSCSCPLVGGMYRGDDLSRVNKATVRSWVSMISFDQVSIHNAPSTLKSVNFSVGPALASSQGLNVGILSTGYSKTSPSASGYV